MDGSLSWKSLFVWSCCLLVVWLIWAAHISNYLFPGLTEDDSCLMMAASLSTDRMSPLIHSSSRYQTFRFDLNLDVTPWMARAKRARPWGSGGWVEAELSLKEIFLKNSGPIWEDRFLGSVFDLLEEVCLGECYWRRFWQQVFVKVFHFVFASWRNTCHELQVHSPKSAYPNLGGLEYRALRYTVSDKLQQPDVSRHNLQQWVSGLCYLCKVCGVVHLKRKQEGSWQMWLKTECNTFSSTH